MRVSVIEPVGNHGGMNYYDDGLCSGLSSAGVDVNLFSNYNHAVDTNKKYKTYSLYKDSYGKRPRIVRAINYLVATIRSLSLSKRVGVRVVHFHMFEVSVLEIFNIILAGLYKFKVVTTVHDIETFSNSKISRKLTQYYLDRNDKLIVHNKTSQNELLRIARVDVNQVVVIEHGNYIDYIDQSYVNSTTVKKRIIGAKGSNIVLFFGQIKEVKGLDVLLEAMSKVSDKDVVLLIAGKSWKTSIEKYQKLIAQLGIADRVVVDNRYIPDNEVADYFSLADLVVLPYRRIYQSGVLIKAMSYKRAVLVSNLDAMMEMVIDEVTGFTFVSGNSDDLANKIDDVLSRPELRKVVAENAYELVATKHSWTEIGNKTKDLYENIVV